MAPPRSRPCTGMRPYASCKQGGELPPGFPTILKPVTEAGDVLMANSAPGRSPRRSSAVVLLFTGVIVIMCACLLTTKPAMARSLPESSGQCTSLGPGSTGPCVVVLQEKLNKNHVKPHLRIDGIYGPLTSEAVESYQRKRGLPVDGIVGAETARALDAQPKRKVRHPAKTPTPNYERMNIPSTSFWSSVLRFPPTTSTLAILCATFLAALAIFLLFAHRIWVHEHTKKMNLRFPGAGKIDAEKHPSNMELRTQLGVKFLKHQPLPPPDDFFRSIESGDP